MNQDNIPVDNLESKNDELEENEIYSKLLRCPEEPIEVKVETVPDEELQEDFLSELKAPSVTIIIISEIPSACEVEQGIASGQRKQSVSILTDKLCEELAHPDLF